MFRCKSVIIHSQRIRDNQSRIILFTGEFWKVTTWYKKKDIPESGSIVEAFIERKGDINTLIRIENTLISREENWSYQEVFSLLSLLKTLYHWLPEWLAQKGIFEDIEVCFSTLPLCHEREQFLLLIHARTMKILWYLKEDFYKNSPLTSYIYKKIDTCAVRSLRESKIIEYQERALIQRSIEEAHQTMTHT
jgi:recombinational DNA repair protein (RecF pathway)